MLKGSKIVYGRGRLARLLGISADKIRYLERTGKIKPAKQDFGDETFNAYTDVDIDYIKKHTSKK